MRPEAHGSALVEPELAVETAAEPGGAHAARRGVLRVALDHAPLAFVSAAVLLGGSTAPAVAWFALCRLGYVGFVGLSLRAESRRAALSRRHGAEEAWRRFRRVAERIMVADAISLVVLCLVTRGTFDPPGPTWLAIVVGLVLVVIGIGIKSWATASLDEGTFYWRDFFVPREHRTVSVSGPYRWLSNPMYGVGYAHAYGFALLVGSWPGLVASACAQVAVLTMERLVERPHLLRRHRR